MYPQPVLHAPHPTLHVRLSSMGPPPPHGQNGPSMIKILCRTLCAYFDNPSILPILKQVLTKNRFQKKKLKNGWIYPSRLAGWGQQGLKSRLLVRLFDFPFFHQNILKEASINYFFKVLAIFGDYKDDKDIKKLWNF